MPVQYTKRLHDTVGKGLLIRLCLQSQNLPTAEGSFFNVLSSWRCFSNHLCSRHAGHSVLITNSKSKQTCRWICVTIIASPFTVDEAHMFEVSTFVSNVLPLPHSQGNKIDSVQCRVPKIGSSPEQGTAWVVWTTRLSLDPQALLGGDPSNDMFWHSCQQQWGQDDAQLWLVGQSRQSSQIQRMTPAGQKVLTMIFLNLAAWTGNKCRDERQIISSSCTPASHIYYKLPVNPLQCDRSKTNQHCCPNSKACARRTFSTNKTAAAQNQKHALAEHSMIHPCSYPFSIFTTM